MMATCNTTYDSLQDKLTAFVSKLSDVPLSCESCENSNPMQWKCSECDMFICDHCENVHSSFPVTKSHEILSISIVADSIKENIQQTIEQLKLQKEKLAVNLKGEDDFLEAVKSLQLKTVETINKHRIELKGLIDKQHDDCIKNTKVFFTEELSKANMREENSSAFLKLECETTIELLSKLESNSSVKELIEFSRKLEKDVKSEPDKVNQALEKFTIPAIPVVRVVGPRTWKETNGTKVFYNKAPTEQELQKGVSDYEEEHIKEQADTLICQAITSEKQTDFLKLTDAGSFYKDSVSVKVNGEGIGNCNVRNICQVGNRLWIYSGWSSSENRLLICDMNCNAIQNWIDIWPLKEVRCICAFSNDHAIVISRNGLLLLSSDGFYLTHISKLTGQNIAVVGDKVYHFDGELKQVILHQKELEEWKKKKVIKIDIKGTRVIDMYIHDNNFYFNEATSIDCFRCISIFSETGKQLMSFEFRESLPVSIRSALLLRIDSTGNMLIADRANNRFLVCTGQGNWYVLKLHTNSHIHGAICDEGGKTIWAVLNSGELVKYALTKVK